MKTRSVDFIFYYNTAKYVVCNTVLVKMELLPFIYVLFWFILFIFSVWYLPCDQYHEECRSTLKYKDFAVIPLSLNFRLAIYLLCLLFGYFIQYSIHIPHRIKYLWAMISWCGFKSLILVLIAVIVVRPLLRIDIVKRALGRLFGVHVSLVLYLEF